MPSFSYDFPYASKKLPIFAANVVASSQHLAATAGLRMLARGGNAVDAAIASAIAITVDIGRQVSLYAFNDWTLAAAGSLADFFSTKSREAPPPGLSDAAIAALKGLRLGERVLLSGRMGEIAGSGVFDLSRLFGKSDADHRQFLLAPRFVARIEALAASKKK